MKKVSDGVYGDLVGRDISFRVFNYVFSCILRGRFWILSFYSFVGVMGFKIECLFFD